MIIKSLKLHNFGVYADDNEFSFEGKKPIVLIGGMNGRGKTTFLEAILLALYGPNSFAYIESEYKSYAQYLRSYVNRDAFDSICRIELCFVNQVEKNQEEYTIIREWEGFSKRLNESLVVYKDGEYSEFLTQNWSLFVENILPSALSNLFIFDGEKIAELAVDTSNEQLKRAIRSMLGISVLDVLKNDLVRNLKRVNNDNSENASNEELNGLRQKRDSIIAELDDLRIQRDRMQIELDANKSKLDSLLQMYSQRGGVASEKRQSTMQKKSDCTSELALINSRLIEQASGDLPLALVKDLLIDIKLQAEEESQDQVLKKSIAQLEKMQKKFAKSNGSDSEGSKAFIAYIKKQSEKNSVKQIYGLSDHSLYQATMLVDNGIDDSVTDVISLAKRKEALEKSIGELDSYLNLDIDTQELNAINDEIKKSETQVVDEQVKLSEIESRITDLNSLLKVVSADFNDALEHYLANAEYHDGAARTTAYSEMVLSVVDRYMVELQKRKADVLGKTITDCYKKLASKRSLIDHIDVNPETLDYIFYSAEGKTIPKDSLSAGEKQVMIIAILWSLAICSKQKLPVIIDTPLSRLDSHHRKTIIKKYFPNASQQTIILSTDSEVDAKYYQMMKENIGDEFTLIYNEETRSTSIEKGYQLGK